MNNYNKQINYYITREIIYTLNYLGLLSNKEASFINCE